MTEREASTPSSRRIRAAALGLFALLGVVYLGSIGLRASRGAEITGDEPFYLLTTQSLLQDGDLDLREQYAAHSYRSFFDHPDGLWYQSVPSGDGRLLSPHNPGLSVLVLPGFALAGLRGVQAQVLLLCAGAFALTFLLGVRLVGRPAVAWFATLGVGVCATPFVYSTEIYPEAPAAFALVAALLLVTGGRRIDPARAVAVVVVLSAIPWLGVKYLPLAAIVGAYALVRSTPAARAAAVGVASLSAIAFVGWHLAVFDGPTPYGVNTVYAGGSTSEILADHVGVGDRLFRIWGLFLDTRFGIGRWAPLLLLTLPGAVLLWRRRDESRLVVALIACQIAIGTFVAITMMGWWFPGRTMMTTLPLLAIPVARFAVDGGRAARAVCWALGVWSASITSALALGAARGEVTLAVDPYDLGALPLRILGPLFPDYRSWGTATILLTLAWLAGGAVLGAWWWRGGRSRRRSATTTPDLGTGEPALR